MENQVSLKLKETQVQISESLSFIFVSNAVLYHCKNNDQCGLIKKQPKLKWRKILDIIYNKKQN